VKKFYPKLRSVQIKTGIWTVVIALILLFSYLWLTNRLAMGSSYQIGVTFSDVNGLEVGDKVVFRGMEVGRVKSIKARGDAIIVLAGVNTEISLQEGSSFQVTDSGLMGGKMLMISPGKGTAKIDITKMQQGTSPEGIMNMIGKASDTLAELQNAMVALQAPDGLLQGSSRLIGSAEDAVQSADLAARELKKELSAVIMRVDRLTAGLNEVVQENRSPLKNSIAEAPATIAKINSTLDSLQTLSGNLNKTAEALHNGDGTAAKLLNNDELYTRLNTSLENLDTLIKDIKAHPKKYVKFSLF
jgi:phospholipid/cholesterol/gamma-HCH transport system substrate-binding protein